MNAASASSAPSRRFDTTNQTRLRGTGLLVGRVAWFVLIGLTILILAFSIPIRIAELQSLAGEGISGTETHFIPPLVSAIITLALDLLSLLVFVGTALALFFHRSDDWMVLLTSIMLATFGGLVVNSSVYLLSQARPELALFVGILQGLGNAFFVLFIYTFPSGRFVPRWSALVAAAGMIWFMFVSLVDATGLGFEGLPGGLFFVVSFAIYGFSALLASVPRWRDEKYGSPTQHQQVKWVYTGLMVALAGFVLWTLPPLVFPSLAGQGFVAEVFSLFGVFVASVSLMVLPVTIALSITRYRLWEVDFFLSRGMIYAILSFVIGIAALGDLFIVHRLLLAVTGKDQAPYALAVAALTVGVAFNPVRKLVQSFIDRNIYGIRLDYKKQPLQAAARDYSGSTIGPYEVEGMIGRGGMAEVYKAIHPTLNRPVAVKMMLPDRASQADFQRRFAREAQTVATLRHSSIIDVFDFGEHEGAAFMVMEYVDGIVLSEYMRQNEKLSLADTVDLLRGVASALDYAHEQGLVHRDIKPSNIMLRQETTASGGKPHYHPILMDFGIAKMLGGHTALTRTGMIGTLDYIAPEQIRDSSDVDGRADVYSMGVVAFEMLTGKLPFVGSNPGAILISHLQQPAPDPRHLRPDLPAAAAEAILRALEKDPANRQPTAGALVDALAAGLDEA